MTVKFRKDRQGDSVAELTFNRIYSELLLHSVSKLSGYPCFAPDKAAELSACNFLQDRYDLNGTATTTNDTDTLALEGLSIREVLTRFKSGMPSFLTCRPMQQNV